jgi:hypothetical protein
MLLAYISHVIKGRSSDSRFLNCPLPKASIFALRQFVLLSPRIRLPSMARYSIFSSINPTHNDMIQRSSSVYAGFLRHVIQISNKAEFLKRRSKERPLSSLMITFQRLLYGLSCPLHPARYASLFYFRHILLSTCIIYY